MQSYSTDLVHSVRKGDTIIAKHFLLALGVNDITGLQVFLKGLFGYYDIL